MRRKPSEHQLPLLIVKAVSDREAEIYFGSAWANALGRRANRLAKNRAAEAGGSSTGVSDTRTFVRKSELMFTPSV